MEFIYDTDCECNLKNLLLQFIQGKRSYLKKPKTAECETKHYTTGILSVAEYPNTLYCLLVIMIIIGCTPTSETHLIIQINGTTMGTQYSIKIADPLKDQQLAELQTGIGTLLENINNSMSTYLETSELSAINQARHDNWIQISDPLLIIIDKALALSNISSGAFDITVGPLVNLWGFGPDYTGDQLPDEITINALKAKIGYQKLQLDTINKRIRKLEPSLYLDLSAIAKGYGVDCVADYLQSRNIKNYLVEIGGELKAHGHRAPNQAWRIAIEEPSGETRDWYKTIELTRNAVASSGDYRNFFEIEGKRYSHTIDPHTGKPVTHNLAAVTVIHSSAMEADGLATLLLVMGPDEGYKLAQDLKLAALFIIRNGNQLRDKSTDLFNLYTVSP